MVSARCVQMMSKSGFTELFWSELARLRKVDDKITHEQVYEIMEEEYQREFGQRRYASWRSFRDNRDR